MLIYYFKKKLGSPELWNYLLAIPIIPALIGAFLLLVFFPETPKALLIKGNDGAATECKKAIFFLNVKIYSSIGLFFNTQQH